MACSVMNIVTPEQWRTFDEQGFVVLEPNQVSNMDLIFWVNGGEDDGNQEKPD